MCSIDIFLAKNIHISILANLKFSPMNKIQNSRKLSIV